MSQRITSRLLTSKIKEATSDGVPLSLSDSELRGLSARISPTGRVTWVASKSIGRGRGSTQRVVIGHYPGMSLNDARIEAGQTIARLARGEDVLSEAKAIKRAKVEQRQCPTIKEASSDYLNQRSGDITTRYAQDVRQLFERQIVPQLGVSTRVNEVSKADSQNAPAQKKAIELIEKLFAQNDKLDVKVAREAAAEAGVHSEVLYKARDRLGLVTHAYESDSRLKYWVRPKAA